MKDIEILKILGDRLEFFHKQKGFIQASLATNFDKSVDTISNIERDKMLFFWNFFMIASVLEVSLDDLMHFPSTGNRKSNDYSMSKE